MLKKIALLSTIRWFILAAFSVGHILTSKEKVFYPVRTGKSSLFQIDKFPSTHYNNIEPV